MGALHHIQFHDRSFVTDYFFDDIVTDMRNHSKIKKSLEDAHRAASELEKNATQVKPSVVKAHKQVDKEHKQLCEARRALDAMRQRIVEDAGLFAPTKPASKVVSISAKEYSCPCGV